jgi:uncharacterized membrane protein YeaQ/YmgE (transglycosylase-associated protein family)
MVARAREAFFHRMESTSQESGATMTILDLIILLIVAAICGSLGMAISGYSHGGCLVSIALGFIGALIGMWLARVLSLPELFILEVGDVPFPIIWSIIGSALFVAVVGFLTRPTSRTE